jgi:hypothetical protein
MIDAKKQYTIDGADYTLVRTSEWYNDETTTEYWLYPGTPANFNQLSAIGTVDDELEDNEEQMPTMLAVKVALNRHGKRALTPRENAEWLLDSLKQQEAHAAHQVTWAKQAHGIAVKNIPDAYKLAEAEVARAAEEVERRENRLAYLRVQIADAHVQLQNG